MCIAEAMDTSAQIEDICLENINLIFEPFSNSYLWDLKTKNKFLYFSKDNFLDDWLANVLEINISNNKTIGTVSYLALSSAKTMGFKKIILCGQDLAFKDGKCYAKGSAYEDLECILNPDTNKYEIIARDYESYKHKLLSKKYIEGKYADYYTKNYIKKLNSTIYTVKGQNGQILPTQACYAIFIKHFENFAKENKISNLKYITDTSDFDTYIKDRLLLYPKPSMLITLYEDLLNKDKYIFDAYTLNGYYARKSQAERLKNELK